MTIRLLACSLNVLIGADVTQTDEGPIHLMEDAATGDRFLVYASDKGARLEIRFQGETLWMTQAQIADLFGRDQSVVSRHVGNIIEEGELDEASNMQKVHTAHSAKPVTIYSLDMVISVGYRVSSAQATLFRRWATSVLVQYAKKGFVVDAKRLKAADNASRIAELRETIRDIRSDEANLYRELQAICALCQDYDGGSEMARKFFQRTQAKLVYAVVGMTPAEVVESRADHRQPDMGLQSWGNENIRKSDVGVSKNYLAEAEIRELNRLTDILLNIFEDQADIGRLVTIQNARDLLDAQLKNLGRVVLDGGGTVSADKAKAKADKAKAKAEGEYAKWAAAQKAERHRLADEAIAALVTEAKRLPRTRR